MPYTGYIAEVPAGAGGLNADENVSRVPVYDLLQAEGIVADSGTWRREPGAVQFGSTITGTPSLLAVADWWPTTTTQKFVCAAADGKLYKDDGAGDLDSVTLKSGLSTTARGWFITGGKEAAANNRKLFYFNGYNIVQVLSGDGATTTDISAPPADWSGNNQPLMGIIHNGRLWGFGNLNDPHRVYASLAANHEDFTTTPMTFSVFPGVGSRLVAGTVYQGRLFLWKSPRGIFWLDDNATDSTYWSLRQKSIALGAAPSPSAVLPIDDDVLFMTTDCRFHLLSAVSDADLSGVRSSDLSAALYIDRWLRENVDLTKLNLVTSIWYAHKKQAMFALPRLGSNTNDLRLIFDFNDVQAGGKVKVFYSFRDNNQALGLRQDGLTLVEKPVLGDNAGKVYKLDQPARMKDDAGYTSTYQTPHCDFSHLDMKLGSVRKNFDALEVVCNPIGNWDLAIDTVIDGAFKQTVNFNMGGGGTALGTFVLGTNQLGGDAVKQRRRRIGGNGYRLSLVGRNSSAGQDFSVGKHIVSFRVAGEEQK